jgi:hypothetical protein
MFVHAFCVKSAVKKKEATIFVPSHPGDTGLAAPRWRWAAMGKVRRRHSLYIALWPTDEVSEIKKLLPGPGERIESIRKKTILSSN